jgi:two-component system chemotaxis sensor kinase CheA
MDDAGPAVMDQLLRDFLDETRDNLEALDDVLGRLPGPPGQDDALARIFRVVHTVKGTCGFLGLARLARAAHAAESVLERLRDGSIPVTPAAIGLVAEHIDRMRLIVSATSVGGVEPELDDSLGGVAALRADRSETAKPGLGSVRVPLDQIDAVAAALLELRRARDAAASGPLGVAPLAGIDAAIALLGARIAKLWTSPLGNSWIGLRRLVRDLGAELGKRIELQLQGAELEIDRRTAELLRDPMIHLVRNAADHGLETCDERRAAGKPEAGRITIRASRSEGGLAIDLDDDGRGFQLGRIRSRAVAAGIVPEGVAASMPDAELARLAFRKGLTTADRLTGVSGRGFGLDVVASNIAALGGTIEIHTTPGQGTRFSILIPDAPPAASLARGEDGRLGRLLLLDDSGGFRDLVEPLLAAAGYEVVTAATAAAVAGLRDADRGFDLILLDPLAPEALSGALPEAIAADPALASVPVLALVSGTSQPVRDLPRQRGRVDRTDSAAILARVGEIVASRGGQW